MSIETLNFPRETTLQRIAVALERQSAMVQVLAQDNLSTLATSWAEIQRLVKEGLGPTVFHVGDQLVTKWKDVAANVEYDYTWDVVSFRPVTLKDGSVVPGMILQAHYATPFEINFDAREALYYAAEELPAGTYNFTITNTWAKATAGTYQFTLTQPIPAGGQIAGPGIDNLADKDPTTWTVSTYANSTPGTAAIETASVSAGSEGTSLGNFTTAGTEVLNSMHRVSYGYNNYRQSAVRQWLNSDKAAGAWWASQNKFDRAPSYATSKAGYLAGFTPEFLAVLANTKVVVSANTITDNGATEEVYDKFFLPSLEEEYYRPQAATGLEGPYWEYWKRVKGLSSPQGQYSDNKLPEAIRYRLNSKTAAYLWYRSATRGNGCYVWFGFAAGSCTYDGAYNGLAVAPACVIA